MGAFLLRRGKLRPIPYFLSIGWRPGLESPACGKPGLGPRHTRGPPAVAGGVSSGGVLRDGNALRPPSGCAPRREVVVPDPAYALTMPP